MPGLYPAATTFPGATTFPEQPEPAFHVLRVSFDNVGTPFADRTWVTIGRRLLRPGWNVDGGRDSELEEMDAIRAVYPLDDNQRALDPTNTGSPHSPNVVPNRMLWHQIHVAGQVHTVFLGYVDGWNPDWNSRVVGDQRARVRASDGSKILTAFSFAAANPDVTDYEEVIQADDPSFYYRLGEARGTKLVSHRRVIRYKRGPKKGKRKRVKRWRTRETRAATTGISGPAGSYRKTPALGQPGAIAGDLDTAVLFRAAQSEQAQIVIDPDDFTDLGALTIECWVKPTTTGDQYLVVGPDNSATSAPIARLSIASLAYQFLAYDTSQNSSFAIGSNARAGIWEHVVGVWDGAQLDMYINGAKTGTSQALTSLLAPTQDRLRIGGITGSFADAALDEVAVYQEALSPARIKAHYDAAFLGFPSNRTGKRIGQALDLVNEFPAWNVNIGLRNMPPTRYAGLEPSEIIAEASDAEGIPAVFFMAKDNVPTFLDSNHRAAAPYNTPKYTFGNGTSEIRFEGATISDQDTFLYNIIRGTAEAGGETFTAEDATSQTQFGNRVLPLSNLPLDNDADVQAYANALLARYKDPFVRITSFTLNGSDADALTALLDLDLGDSVRVKISAPGDPNTVLLDQTSFVERRRIWQDDGPVMGEFSISPR